MFRIKNLLCSLARVLATWTGHQGLLAAVNIYSQRTYDNALLIRAAGAAITATETGATIIDVGTGLLDADLVVDVTAMDVTTGDEGYSLLLEGSPDAAFGTSANITVVAQLTIGGATAAAPVGTADTIGRFLIPFRNERNGTTFRYLRLKTVIAGTTPSLTFSAFIAKDDD